MQRLKLTSLFLILVLGLQAQTKISGTVVDRKGEPVIGANVMIAGTYDGASTDVNGQFSFSTTESGNQQIKASFIGYKELTQDIELNNNELNLSLTIEEAVNKLNAVVITAGSFNASEDGQREVLKSLDIATTAGATADVAGALNTLPGTQKVGESGRLFVRGGAGYETRTFIDGLAVLNAYSPAAPNTPSRGRFSPFMFKGVSFSTGGYSAEYGQALSSALVMDTKGLETIDRGDIAIMSVGGSYSHNKSWDNSSLSAKAEYIDLAPYVDLVPQEIEWIEVPKTFRANYAYRIKTSKTGMFKTYGSFDMSRFELTRPDIDNESIRERINLGNNYQHINTSYSDVLSDLWSIRGGVSFTRQWEDIKVDSFDISQIDQGIHAKVALQYDLSDQVSFNFGTELLTHNYSEEVQEHGQLVVAPSFDQWINASFVEAEWYLSNNFGLKTGLRTSYNHLQNRWFADPRASLAYKTGEFSQMSLAYGSFRQDAQADWLKVNADLDQERATHYIINYQIMKDRRTFRVESYHKEYKDLVKYDNADLWNPTSYNNNGFGHARGLDVFWRDNKTFKGTDYWVSYSYLDTERDYLNFPQVGRPGFASSHNFSVVYKRFIQRLKTQVGATYSYTSGRAYTNPNQEGFQNNITRAYQDLSVNFSYLMRSNVIIHGSVTNVLGFDNVFGYEYSNQPNTQGQFNERAVGQPAPRFIFLGVFITLSKEKTMNQMSNL